MVIASFDEHAIASLRPGPFPSGASVEVQEVWMAVSALEDRIRGEVTDLPTEEAIEGLLSPGDRVLLTQLAARVAVILALRE
jgi:hypothetical protein